MGPCRHNSFWSILVILICIKAKFVINEPQRTVVARWSLGLNWAWDFSGAMSVAHYSSKTELQRKEFFTALYANSRKIISSPEKDCNFNMELFLYVCDNVVIKHLTHA